MEDAARCIQTLAALSSMFLSLNLLFEECIAAAGK
jgi:hypothetical protein